MLDRVKCVNVPRIKRLIQESGLDAVLVSSAETLPSLSAFYHWDVAALQEFPHYVLWPAKGEPCFIGPSRRGHLRKSPIITDTRSYTHDVQRKGNASWRATQVTPVQQVAGAIRDRDIAAGRIGVEMRHFQLGYALELQQLLPDIRLEDCEGVLDRIRAVKTPAEVEHLRIASYATDKALALGLTMARPGDSEKKVSNRISSLLLEYGASALSHAALCSGERCRTPHHAGTESAILREGDLVAADFGGVFEGYITDMARMAVVGKPTLRQSDWYSRMGHAHLGAIGRIVAGLPVKELVRIIREELKTVGMTTKYEMLGHSLGIGVHDWPMITPHSDAVLEQDMVLAVEIMTEDPDTEDRFETEDIIRVTSSGAERLTNFSSPAELLRIS